MFIPAWAAALSFLGVIGAAVIAGYFGLRNNNRNAGVSEIANLLHGQQDLISSLSANTGSYQELLLKYAEIVQKEAKTAAALETITGELSEMKGKFDALQASFDALKIDYIGERERASQIPKLEKRVAELMIEVRMRDDAIRELNAVSDVALRAQGMAEGAMAERTGAKPVV